MNHYVIRVLCPDRKGILAAVTGLLAAEKANIVDLTQHTAPDLSIFMLKCLFDVPENFKVSDFEKRFEDLASQYEMQWNLNDRNRKQKIAVFVSKTNHCLWELLLKHRDGELNCDISMVLSNHRDNEPVAQLFDIPYYQVDYKQGKPAAEAQIEELLTKHPSDFIVLARFMQILSGGFTRKWENRILNIHHGFLPAFQGARPYHQAWYKGVKIIGATAHIANENLDQGPIVAQEVLHASDKLSIEQLVLAGKDVERKTLFNAVQIFLNYSLFVIENRTFVLD